MYWKYFEMKDCLLVWVVLEVVYSSQSNN